MLPARETKQIELCSLSVRYLECGPSDGEPVVVLHALGASADDWTDIATALADRWRVLAPDLRGHGGSDRPGAYSFEFMRDDLVAFLDALELSRAHVIGHSMGGTVAYLFAETFSHRLDRLIIVDTPPPFPARMPEPEAIPSDLPFDGRVILQIVRQLNAPDPAWWDQLPRIEVPVLVIGGGSTSFIPQDKLAEVAARVPHGRLVTLEGAGHSVHRTRPAEFVELVRGFLGEARI